MMEDVKILRLKDIKSASIPGAGREAGWMKRIVHPANINTKSTFMGLAEVNPGHSPHRWHIHIKDKAEGYEITYPEGFEEVYHIIRGSGTVQWKTADGQVKEEGVSAGDTIFFPPGVGEHQLLNNGSEKIYMVFCGSPLPIHKFG
jgi:mannose-6-phosphate isomerase-like protein (cupin superfamily)